MMIAASMAGLMAPMLARAAASDAGDAAVLAPITALDAALIALMKQGSKGENFKQRYDTLMPVIAKIYDLDMILSVSVGLIWSQIPAAQQATLKQVFAAYTVATYVSSFDSYNGQRFTEQKTVRVLGPRRIVATQLVPKTGKPVDLDYVMTQIGADWRITDVLFDGTISKVATQRSDFSGLVMPGDASKLIAALRKKVATLSGGAITVN
ncbi:MAG: toluene tolerance protein [Acidiphilium sp. 37-60-79]|nr:MAG: toluene tolerance protein [Acidiphilium sp. 37-60-79]OZB39205.1 MAG: toluene tolerance protein [Acidiphilium sp. 34-60-192]